MTHFKELYIADALPIFQNRMYSTQHDGKHCITGDVVLIQDMDTGLIFNQAFKPGIVQYDADYQNEQAVSLLFREHLNDVSKIINQYFQNCRLIEIGCGKGFFLEHLQKIGFKISGLDPTYEGQNSKILKKYFSSDMNLHTDGIILRHVLEHVQDPVNFLANIKKANRGRGKIYIEVPCFDWICKHHAWFDIFYEHVNYFRISDFIRIFETVEKSGHVFGGQYLYIVADLSTLRKPTYDDQCDLEFPSNFLASISHYADRLNIKAERYSVVWGGASKGVIFSIFIQRAGSMVDFVVDMNPAKQGKYLPVTGLRVYSPKDVIERLNKPTDIFVMNSNYLNEIREQTNNQFNYITVDHEII